MKVEPLRIWPLKPVGSITAGISDLKKIIRHLPFELGPEGPWVAGGAVVAAVLGWQPDEARDLDVLFASKKQRDAAAAACRGDAWISVGAQSAVATDRYVNDGISLDFADLDMGPLPRLLSRFDLSICQVATDGKTLWATEATVKDLRRRRFRIMRPTTPGRVSKYLGRGLGLWLAPEHKLLQRKLWEGDEAPPLTSLSLTREEALGLGEAT